MILLGSTGSIGVNTLLVAEQFNICVEVLVCGTNIELLNKQILKHSPKVVVVKKKEDIKNVNHKNVYFGDSSIIEVIKNSSSDLVVNALVGFFGLNPTLESLKAGKKVALANKESLVVCGAFIDTKNIIPIDSEHFGLWYLMKNRPIEKMIITASGGAFRDWDLKNLKNASLADTQKHPNWNMGQKITIDSATMINKLFELLEARWLFGEGKYDAIIETQSLIHALIDFKDGSSTAHIAGTDMRLPISYALNEKMDEKILKNINLLEVGSLEFREIKSERYSIWEIKNELLKNPLRGVVINRANEFAIERFIKNEIGFLDISKIILKAFNKFHDNPKSIEEILLLDKEVEKFLMDNK